MDILQVVVLSLIQGLTEFLPISSSAHLILPSRLLGWQDQGLAFDVACHVGTLLAVIFFYRQRLWRMVICWCREFSLNPLQKWQNQEYSSEARMMWFVILSTIPVCLAGLLLNSVIEEIFRNYAELTIAVTTIVFGLLLWFSDWFGGKHHNAMQCNQMTLTIALLIGLAQILAFIPGTSRSGITITVALLLGLKRTDAADYSFLLSIPLIMAAGSYSALKVLLNQSLGAADAGSMVLGIVLSGISAFVVIKLFIKFIGQIGMLPFVIYRLILGAVLLAIVFGGAGAVA